MPEPVRVVPIPCPFGLGGFATHVYYVDAPEPAIVDTGVAASPSAVVEPALAKMGIRLSDVRWILASHGHWDHIGGVQTAKDRAADDVKLAMHPADAELLGNRRAHVAGYGGMRFRYIDDPAALAQHDAMLMENLSGELIADRALADGDRIDLGGGLVVNVVHTPGHSRGAVTFVLDGLEWAFTGDSVQVGGANGIFPLIPEPAMYRQSMRRLLDDVRPSRLFMGHEFGALNGGLLPAQMEGDAVATAIRDSIAVEERLAAAAARIVLPTEGLATAETFAPAAAALGWDASAPASWPPSLFATLSGYLPPDIVPPPPVPEH